MPNYFKTAARLAANSLPLYRVYAGRETARRLRTDMRDPRDRTWAFAGRVAADIATDKADGWLADYAGPTRLGGYLDQMSDKAWYLQITRQLVANGELKKRHLHIPAARDIGATLLRTVAQHYDYRTDAVLGGKLKLNAQAAATIAKCSPLAYEQPLLVECLYETATAASVGSGAEMLLNLIDQLSERYTGPSAAQFIISRTTELRPLLQAA